MKPIIYGIGNPLIDLNYRVSDQELNTLGLSKGIMHLLDESARDGIISGLGRQPDGYAAGGDCPNTMVSTALLGTPTAFSGKVGEDDFGQRYEERLRETGVMSKLSFGSGKTGSSIILVTPDGERTMNTYLGMCQEFSASDLDRPLMSQCEALFLTGYFWDTPIQKEAMNAALDMANKLDRLIAFDAADPFAVGRSKIDFRRILDEHVDIAFANLEEARALFDCDSPNECAKAMSGIVRTGAIKTGSKGALAFLNGDIFPIPSYPVDVVVDTTGAGDNFAAGFLHGIFASLQDKSTTINLNNLTSQNVIKAGKLATFVASKIISRVGPQLQADEAQWIVQSLKNGAGKDFLA